MPVTQATALQHQSYQPFPKIDTPISEPDGTINISWFRLLSTMWQRLGQIGGQTVNAAYIRQSPTGAGAPLQVVNSVTGAVIGTISLGNQTPLPPVPQAVGASPQTFPISAPGTLVVENAQVELARGAGGQFYVFGLAGAAVPVLPGDQVRVTWYGATAPRVTLFPYSLS